MPGATSKKDLYIGKSLADLNSYTEVKNKTSNVNILVKSAEKTFKEAERSDDLGDEERAYILFMKYFNVLTIVKTKADYKKQKEYFDSLIGAKNQLKAIDRAEKLSCSLKERYELREAKAVAEKLDRLSVVEDSKKNDEKEVEETKEKSSSNEAENSEASNGHDEKAEGEPGVVTPMNLYQKLSSGSQQLLILDARPAEDFQRSHIKHKSCVSVPQEIVKPGSTVTVMEQSLPSESLLPWRQRGQVEQIVLVDWASELKDVAIGTTLRTLKDALFKYDSTVILKKEPAILEGGYEQWLLFYPMFCTNPHVSRPSTEQKSSTDMLDFDYPEFEEPKPEPARQEEPVAKGNLPSSDDNNINLTRPTLPKVDRSTKPQIVSKRSTEGRAGSEPANRARLNNAVTGKTGSRGEAERGEETTWINNPLYPNISTPGLSTKRNNVPVAKLNNSDVVPRSEVSKLEGDVEFELTELARIKQEKEKELSSFKKERERLVVEQRARIARLKDEETKLEELAFLRRKEERDVADLLRKKRGIEEELQAEKQRQMAESQDKEKEESARLAELAVIQAEEREKKQRRQEEVERLRQERKKKEEERKKMEALEKEAQDNAERLRREEEAARERRLREAAEAADKLRAEEEEARSVHEEEETGKKEEEERKKKEEQHKQHLLMEQEEVEFAARMEREKKEKERQEKERQEKERVEKERQEKERLEKEVQEKEIQEKERQEKERQEKERHCAEQAREAEERAKAEKARRDAAEKSRPTVEHLQPKKIPSTNLPTGWEKRWDRATNRYFYIDHHHGLTQWEPPPLPPTPSTPGTYKARLKEEPEVSSSRGLSRSHSSPDIMKLMEEESQKPAMPMVDRTKKPSLRTEMPTSARSISQQRHMARKRDFNPVYGSVGPALTGLRNLGNTCYMNSTIQCLVNTPQLVSFFLTDQYVPFINRDGSESYNGEVVDEFAAVVKALWGGTYRCIVPRDFKITVGRYNKMFCGYEQQDSQEFLTFLLDGLHEGLNEVRVRPHIPEQNNDNLPDVKAAEIAWENHKRLHSSIIVELFQGQLRYTNTCESCRAQSKTFQAFMFLSLPVPNLQTITLKDCLNTFLKPEQVTDWNCPRCKAPRRAQKRIDIWKLPRILIICLMRFSCSGYGLLVEKICDYVDFPITGLDLGNQVVGQRPKSHYNLFGTSNHFGSTGGGHYTAVCRNPCSNAWHKFDDSEVTEIPLSKIKSSAAYLLFYTSLDNMTAQIKTHK